MKAFLVKHKSRYNKGERDHLVISSTKQEALKTFENKVTDFSRYDYLKKDVEEVNITELELASMELYPEALERYGLSECVEFAMTVKFEPYSYCENQLISKDEKTTKELISLFKEKNASFFKDYIC